MIKTILPTPEDPAGAMYELHFGKIPPKGIAKIRLTRLLNFFNAISGTDGDTPMEVPSGFSSAGPYVMEEPDAGFLHITVVSHDSNSGEISWAIIPREMMTASHIQPNWIFLSA